jgi:hypothetical protein
MQIREINIILINSESEQTRGPERYCPKYDGCDTLHERNYKERTSMMFLLQEWKPNKAA